MSLFRHIFRFLWDKRVLLTQAFLLCSVVLVWAFFQRDAIFDYLDSLDRYQLEKARTKSEEALVRDLKIQRDALSSGAQGSEGVVREAFHLTKPGEEVLILEPAAEGDWTSSSLSGPSPGPGLRGLDLP